MMFLRSLGFRNVEGPHKLVGPTIRDTRKLSFFIDDTQVTLCVPKHKTRRRVTQRNPSRHYHTKTLQLPPMYPNAKGDWDALRCISRTCDFYGPVFTHALGASSVHLSVYSPLYPKLDVSFFHPRVFEYTIAELLTLEYGDIAGLDGQEWLAPSQWGDGFDMHFTPGNDTIGGWRSVKQARHAATNTELHESALLLAHTMERAKNIDRVNWMSQAGGSGVLTQAMKILVNKGVTIDEERRQHVYFSHLTTNLNKAQTLAQQLGLKFTRYNHSANKFNLNELVGGVCLLGDIVAGIRRTRNDKDYSCLNYGVDLLKGGNAHWEYVSLTRAAPIAISAAVAAGGTAGVYSAVFAAATASAGLGKALFKAWLPESYRRLVGKL